MHLQWKYTLIINLSVLIIMVTFYVIDDIKARKDLKVLHIQNVENGAVFRDVVEKIRLYIVDRIEKDGAFNRNRIENEIRALKKTDSIMDRVVDIHVTLGRSSKKIQASLAQEFLFDIHLKFQDDLDNHIISAGLRQAFGSKEKPLSDWTTIKPPQGNTCLLRDKRQTYFIRREDDRLNVYAPKKGDIFFADGNLSEVDPNSVQVYNLVQIDNGKYATVMNLGYQTGVIGTEMADFLFSVGLAHQRDLNTRHVSDGVRQAFKNYGRRFSTVLAHQSDLDSEHLSKVLRKAFEDYGIPLSQNTAVSTNDDGWLIADWDNQAEYAARKSDNQLNIYDNRYLLSQDVYVSIQNDADLRWSITDKANQHTYFVAEDEDKLNIYADWAPASEQITGIIQVFFEAPDIAKHIGELRLMHLIYMIVVSLLLVIIIYTTTTHLIMRPLERMMEIIKRAEAGDLESLQYSYSSSEIDRVTYSLVRMLKQLRDSHSKRIAALGQFAAGVAHEIRNPLNTIGMTTQHLKDLFSQGNVKPDDIEEAQEFMEIVNYEIEQLKGISEQFVTLNRPKALKLESTDLNALLDQVMAEFTLMMENAKVKVIRNYALRLQSLQLDSGLIRQAIFNLIQNSVQAMSKGGRIYITTALEQTITGEEVALEIRDTGIGVPDEIQERIFDAYFTTKESEGGMGLGLAISHQIISAHQGKIEIRSKVGMGTAFKIFFPVGD